MPYGTVLTRAQLAASPLPTPRGPLSELICDTLTRDPHRGRAPHWTEPVDDPLFGDDAALALYCLYELHYRGWQGVSDGWEWNPGLIEWRQRLESEVEIRLRDEVGELPSRAQMPDDLLAVLHEEGGPSLSAHLLEEGTVEQFQESVIHRSAWQLKEADPYTWAIPRLAGLAKAACVEIQADEYGGGVERDMHQTLYGVTMMELGLDAGYHAYLDRLPGFTLAGVNVVSMFGLNRRWLGALVGHLAMFEMSSVGPMGANAAALRRLGYGSDARHFYAVHVVADAHHQTVAAEDLATGLADQDPDRAVDILFGARAVNCIEQEGARRILTAWENNESSLYRAYVAEKSEQAS